MKEVEILVRVFDSKKDALVKLSHLEPHGIKHTVDTYFYDPLRNTLQPNDGKAPSQWFRLREQGNQSFITYKTDIFDHKKWLYSEEEETSVEDPVIARKIIDLLNFKSFVTVDNTKYVFLQGDYELVLEDVNDLGLFLEVERLNCPDDADISDMRREILEFIENLGIHVSEELNIGKPELILQKKGIIK